MYYLNDKHPKNEYAIYKKVNNACPYICSVFSNLAEVEKWFEEVEKRHNRYHQTYYFDASGYKNIYPVEFATYYYKLLVRTVNDWQEIA